MVHSVTLKIISAYNFWFYHSPENICLKCIFLDVFKVIMFNKTIESHKSFKMLCFLIPFVCH